MQPFNLSPQNKQYLFDKIDKLDPTRQWQVIIQERQSKRSVIQNERLWSLYTALGDHLGESKDKVHELMGYKFLRYQTTVAGESVELIKSTTKLTTKDMAEYQENIENWAALIGFIWEYHP